MSETLLHKEMKEILNSFLQREYTMNSNDPLANVYAPGVLEFHDLVCDSNPEWEKLIRSSKSTEKEFGLNPLCKTSGIVKLHWNGKHFNFPILLNEVKATIEKLTQKITISLIGDEIINPFLVHFFEFQLQICIPNSLEEIQYTLQDFNELTIDLESQFIGNFHPHRYEIIRDIESLLNAKTFSAPLKQLVGIQDQDTVPVLPLSSSNLIQSDPDQLQVFQKLESSSCLVQGPPGTGKSQVIVNTIGNLLEAKETVVVVSEKRVALDVIHKKMSGLGIGGFCFTTTHHFSNTHFIQELKKEWNRIEEMKEERVNYQNNFPLSVQELQNVLNLLHQPGLVGKTNVIELLSKINIENEIAYHPFSSALPTFDEWVTIKEQIHFIFENQLTDLLVQLKTELIEKSYLLSLESKILLWKQAVKRIAPDQTTFSVKSLYELARTAVVFSKFDTQIAKKFNWELITNQTKRKKIEKIRLEIIQLNVQLEKLEVENNHWLTLPNEAEVDGLFELFQQKGFVQRIKQQNTWKKWTRSTFLNPVSSLEFRRNQLNLLQKKQGLVSILHGFGIDSESDLEEARAFIQSVSLDEINLYQSTSSDQQKFYQELHPTLNNLLSDFHVYFRFEDQAELISYLDLLEKKLNMIFSMHSKFPVTPKSISFLLQNFSTIDEMEKAVLGSAWSKLKIDFPQLAQFNWGNFYQKTAQSLEVEQVENRNYAQFLLQEQKIQFEYFHTLLRTENNKLSPEKKTLKQQLKSGKRILVKEFSKSKSHSSIRNLMESDAAHWIYLLKPVWLVNPARMSTCFPLAPSLFSVAIFDEASQIPFEHAIGSLQRANRILVAGDPQQMSPSSYFSANKESIDLLHQANYYLPSLFLSFHYRSQHPSLIHFSNTYFYEGRLKAFRHAHQTNHPIDFHYVENGYFENRVNKTEAQKVALYISSKINGNETLGIVAFSESQLACIYSSLSDPIRTKLHQRIEMDEVFFKSVENVQGDECDELIISFGYGYNEKDGDFSMRFGPINLANGPKRLNVLFSRARKKISFFASVTSKDFKPSSNEAIELLRKWFAEVEKPINENQPHQPSISFRSLVESNSNMLTINTLLSVYKQREWEIEL